MLGVDTDDEYEYWIDEELNKKNVEEIEEIVSAIIVTHVLDQMTHQINMSFAMRQCLDRQLVTDRAIDKAALILKNKYKGCDHMTATCYQYINKLRENKNSDLGDGNFGKWINHQIV